MAKRRRRREPDESVVPGVFLGLFDFAFEKNISTKLIWFVYFLGLILAILSAIIQIVGGWVLIISEMFDPFLTPGVVAMGVLAIVSGIIGSSLFLLVFRLICESAIVFFQMAERLKVIADVSSECQEEEEEDEDEG